MVPVVGPSDSCRWTDGRCRSISLRLARRMGSGNPAAVHVPQWHGSGCHPLLLYLPPKTRADYFIYGTVSGRVFPQGLFVEHSRPLHVQ